MTEFNYLIPSTDMTELDWDLCERIIFDKEPYKVIPRGSDILDILKDAGIFPSKNEARRQWKRGDLKEGMNDWERIGKLRHRLFVHVMPETLGNP